MIGRKNYKKKTNKYLKRAGRVYLTAIDEHFVKKAGRKAGKLHRKAIRSQKRAERFESKMRKIFSEVKMSEISKEDLAIGKEYIDMLKRR